LHYMVLEFVDGFNLRTYLAKKGPPPLPLALSLMRQAASALVRAGELGIVHRDIKPDNILLTRKGEVKVTDFGLSRILADKQPSAHLTQDGVTMGTPLFMSPEQVQGGPVDPRTDIYSLGITFYTMLTGNPPYCGQSPYEVAWQHVHGQPKPLREVRPDLPAELCVLVHKMMEKAPAKRYQTGRELFKELTKLRDQVLGLVSVSGTEAAIVANPTPTMPMSLEEAFRSTPTKPTLGAVLPLVTRRRWRRWIITATLGLALFAGIALGWSWSPSANLLSNSSTKTDDAVSLMSSPQDHEHFLQAAVKRFANPANSNEITDG